MLVQNLIHTHTHTYTTVDNIKIYFQQRHSEFGKASLKKELMRINHLKSELNEQHKNFQ